MKCPKCGGALAIPAGAAPAAAAPAAPAKPARPAPSEAAPNPYAQTGRDLFSEAGIKSIGAGMIFCPGCGKPMPQNAVLCVQCGYHKEKGRRLESVSTGGAPAGGGGGGHGGHGGDTVATTLARAAAALDEAKVEELKTRSQGMPAWMYGGMLIGLLLLTYYMATVGVGGSLISLGVLILIGCSLGNFYYAIMILVVAAKEGALQVILNLFVPFYAIYYVITRWDAVGNFFIMQLYMGLIAMLGYGFIFAGAMLVAASQSGQSGELLRQAISLLA